MLAKWRVRGAALWEPTMLRERVVAVVDVVHHPSHCHYSRCLLRYRPFVKCLADPEAPVVPLAGVHPMYEVPRRRGAALTGRWSRGYQGMD
jgi:hypothetical protein